MSNPFLFTVDLAGQLLVNLPVRVLMRLGTSPTLTVRFVNAQNFNVELDGSAVVKFGIRLGTAIDSVFALDVTLSKSGTGESCVYSGTLDLSTAEAYAAFQADTTEVECYGAVEWAIGAPPLETLNDMPIQMGNTYVRGGSPNVPSAGGFTSFSQAIPIGANHVAVTFANPLTATATAVTASVKKANAAGDDMFYTGYSAPTANGCIVYFASNATLSTYIVTGTASL